MFDRDRMNMAPLREVASASFAVLDKMQDEETEVAVPAVAAAFLLMCEHHDLIPQDVFVATKNIINSAEGRRPEFTALVDFMEGEWGR